MVAPAVGGGGVGADSGEVGDGRLLVVPGVLLSGRDERQGRASGGCGLGLVGRVGEGYRLVIPLIGREGLRIRALLDGYGAVAYGRRVLEQGVVQLAVGRDERLLAGQGRRQPVDPGYGEGRDVRLVYRFVLVVVSVALQGCPHHRKGRPASAAGIRIRATGGDELVGIQADIGVEAAVHELDVVRRRAEIDSLAAAEGDVPADIRRPVEGIAPELAAIGELVRRDCRVDLDGLDGSLVPVPLGVPRLALRRRDVDCGVARVPRQGALRAGISEIEVCLLRDLRRRV